MDQSSHSGRVVINSAQIQFQRLEEMLVPATDFRGEYRGVAYPCEKRMREHYKDSARGLGHNRLCV